MRVLIFASPFLALALWGVASNALGNRDNGSNRPAPTGPATKRSFAVGSFNAVTLDGSDNVRVIRGPAMSVTATGSKRVLDLLDIRVERNTLKIDRKSGRMSWSWNSDGGAVITVTMPAITAASVSGSGDMFVDRADGDSFSGAVEGSGNLKIASVSVKRAQLAAAGSGSLIVAGTTMTAAMAAEGSGNIDAHGLASNQATITADGSGDVDATVRGRATIAVNGSGNVDVAGTDNCTIAKGGSGDARCSR